jgi:RNA polymerase sigma-70 factor (ECF subfamily)
MQMALTSVLATLEDERVEIVRGLKRRDGEVLDWLIERYQHRLFRYLLHLTGRRDVAEELFQETWVRVLERGHLYNDRYPFIAWLLTIARHLMIDWLRRRQPESLDALMDAESDAKPLDLVAGTASPFEALAVREESNRITAALERVPALFREVLLLRFREELSLDEIAAIIGAPVATAKSRLYRGLRSLATQFAENS